MQTSKRFLMAVVTLTAVASGCGSGPELGQVTGTVRVNGQPLPFAYVVFQPIDPPGTYGSAYADAEGKYVLQFSAGRKGAPLGKHQVSIRAAGRDELPDGSKTTPVKLPEKYNSASELIREVNSGANVHDFELIAAPR